MKVILVKDVARLGRKSEIKEVPAGHAFNFLIPRKLAIPATPENLKRYEALNQRMEARREENTTTFKEALEKLKGEEVEYKTEANEQGHLFKGVNAADIAKALHAAGFSIEREDIVLEHPLKEVGAHEVPLRRGEVTGVARLIITKN